MRTNQHGEVPGGASAEVPPAMALALSASFGSLDGWCAAVTAPGPAGAWRLCFSPREGRLVTRWAGMHGAELADADVLLLAGDAPASVSMTAPAGQGAGAGGVLPAGDALAGIDWAGVHARYQAAVNAASEGLAATADQLPGTAVLDVRRRAVFQQADAMLPGARWRDPACIDDWADGLPRTQPVVVYCVHGHEVSRAAALRLRAAGVDARFLDGGIAAWQAAGRAVRRPPSG